jgi:hypothetical protein
MLHSLGRIGKKKTEPAPQQSAEPQQPAGEPTIQQHAATVSKWIRQHQHHELADKVDALGAKYSAPAVAASELAPYQDVAKHVLFQTGAREHGVPFEKLADLYDIFYSVRTAAELADKIKSVDVPNELKTALYNTFLSHREQPKTTTYRDHIENAVNVVKRVASMQNSKSKDGVSHLEAFEKRPNILKAIGSAIGIGKKDNE